MSTADVVRLAFVLCCLMPRASAAQVPAELQEAMRARDEAIAKADATLGTASQLPTSRTCALTAY